MTKKNVRALVGVATPHVHVAENNTIRLALIGCGGRGSGAVANAMRSAHGPVKLVAMADVVEVDARQHGRAPRERSGRTAGRTGGALLPARAAGERLAAAHSGVGAVGGGGAGSSDRTPRPLLSVSAT